MSITVSNGGDGFFIPYKDFPLVKADMIHPFPHRLIVVKDRSPRHPDFEYILDMGYGNINRVFENQPFPYHELDFFMPERWMSVHEQQSFMQFLHKHSQVKEIKSLTVVTSCPLIVSDFARTSIRIVQYGTDYVHGKSS